MARPKSEKNSEPTAPAERRASSRWRLRIGDRLADETGEWEVIGRAVSDGWQDRRTSASQRSS
jgi:hypothetical protein